jgi:catechol 2,3-dioxygenase-like lactoylglutathione lyase family enzyme
MTAASTMTSCSRRLILAAWLFCLYVVDPQHFAQAFTISNAPSTTPSTSLLPLRAQMANANENNHHPMAATSRLSHAMLKVPSVDKTLEYWKEKGGTVRISKEKPGTINGDSELLSAFLELGCIQPPKQQQQEEEEEEGKTNSPASSSCFALELVATNKENYSVGNVISYIGVSMLLQFQNNLLGAITGEEQPRSQGEEPNGIPVTSAASAPGDFLARLCLKSNDLAATCEFYTSVLGMEAKAQDDQMICLRYDNDCFSAGIPTTLCFEAATTSISSTTTTTTSTTEELDMGDCLDHVAVATQTSIEEIYQRSKTHSGCKIFMKPTEMFGKEVMGLIDPNGYKIVIASQ